MRILELCLSDGYGGLELYVVRIAKRLYERGHEVHAMVLADSFLAQRVAETPVPLFTAKVQLRRWPLLAAWRLARWLRQERIDVIHVNWAPDLALAALAKALSRCPVKLVHSRHMNITRPKFDPYHRFLYQSLDALVVLSELMRGQAQQYLPIAPERVDLVYLYAPDPPRVADAVPRAGPLRVATFARIEPAKGQHLLIAAVKQLHDQGVDIQTHIIGHAMDTDYLAQLKAEVTQQGLSACVEFAEFHPAPQTVMAEYHVILLATRNETGGLVLVEAMRCGVCVIASNAGGMPEMIDHGRTGLLFEPGSASSLAEQLKRLAEDEPFRVELALAGRRFADARYSEENHIARLEHVFVGQ